MTKRSIAGIFTTTRVISLIFTVSILLSILFPTFFPGSQDVVSDWIKGQPYNQFLFIVIQIIQVLIPPLSHYFTSILGGFVYGAIWGGVLNWVGRTIGQFLAYIIAYRFGNFLRRKFNFDFEPFEKLVGRDETVNIPLRAIIIFTMIALPFFPDDELSYAMGIAKFPFKWFVLITITGHLLGSFSLAFIGSKETLQGPLFIFLASLTVLAFGILIYTSVKFKKKTNAE